ncbi:MarR family winged helix-turn-helix transcriptional regulator [Cellulomonas endophytica]|uniref:MarR family winged helix-turn-helix transcriptional regulator n=1 Tax=Cellulomonas endophytica TaxID=2494735 RepID=UPI001F0C1C19|nr:MarR family transcriptional regulator [Cellulomonas endophytica]
MPEPSGPPLHHWPDGRLLSAVARRIERAWDAHLAHWDLTHASLPVLVHLLDGPRSQRELAALLDVTEQTTSRILARLERTRYVTRTAHPEDRRRYVIAVTAAGRAALAAASDPRPAEDSVLGVLSGAQRAELRALLLAVHPPV